MAYTTINKSTDHFNTKLYTGNGASPRSITGVGFRPDLVWTKDRSDSSTQPWHDVCRGPTYAIRSDSTSGNENTPAYGYINSFDSDGYTFQQGSSDIGRFNDNSNLYVSWNFKAGGSAVTNNVGTLTSSVSCNNTAGISIITWTGDGSNANVGTGFTGTETIGFATCKKLSTTSEWQTGVYDAYGSNARNFAYHLELNSTSALSGSSPYMLGTQTSGDPTKLKLGSEGYLNGVNYIAYVFKPVKGFSKIGTYTGTDGAFIYTGFKPSFILGKNSGGTYDWWIFDNKRDSFNDGANNLLLRANDSSAEATFTYAKLDFLSNGFKIYGTDNTINGNGATMVYMAFAEAPLVGSNNIPCTAR